MAGIAAVLPPGTSLRNAGTLGVGEGTGACWAKRLADKARRSATEILITDWKARKTSWFRANEKCGWALKRVLEPFGRSYHAVRASFPTRSGDYRTMNDHIYKKIELVGSSPNGIEEAVNNAVNRAAKTVRNMRWFEVADLRGHIENDKIAHWQVTVKIGFTLDT